MLNPMRLPASAGVPGGSFNTNGHALKLADRCRHWFPPAVQEWGEILAAQGRVQLRQREAGLLTALVTDVSGKSYVCGLSAAQTATHKRLELGCECPLRPEQPSCSHLWALLLTADRQNLGKLVPGSGPLETHRNEHPTFLNVNSPGTSLALRQRARELAKQMLGEKLLPAQVADIRKDWRLWLEVGQALIELGPHAARAPAAKTRRLWYFLDLPFTLQFGHPAIRLGVQEIGKSGAGLIQPAPVVHSRDLLLYTDLIDQELISLLASDQFPGERFQLTVDLFFAMPALLDLLMTKMAASQRFVLHEQGGVLETQNPDKAPLPRLEWDAGPQWQFGMSLAGDGTQQQVVGRFVRGTVERPLSEVKALLPSGVVIFGDRVARFAAEPNYAWARLLCTVGSVPISAADQPSLFKQLIQHPQVPRVDVPAELGWEQLETPLCPRIGFTPLEAPYRNRLGAKVGFRYGPLEAEWRKTEPKLVDPDRRWVAYRRLDEERELVEGLQREGLTVAPDPLKPQYDFTVPARALPNLVPILRAGGWEIEAEGRRIRFGTTFGFSVASQVDWFELTGNVEFEGVAVALPTLLKAIERGERYVLLDDGTQGMLPEEWLEKFAGIAALGKTDGDAVRFTQAQAVLLDTLLQAAPQARVDERFTELRERLKQFEHIPPCEEPSGFRGELRNYQRDGLAWLSYLKDIGLGGCLADDMGLGKTIQVLALLCRHHIEANRRYGELPPLPPPEVVLLAETNGDEDDEATATDHSGTDAVPTDDNGDEPTLTADDLAPTSLEGRLPTLVVVPRSLVHNWLVEAEKFAPALRVLNYTGLTRHVYRPYLKSYDVVLTTYGTLRRDILFLRRQGMDYCILDEAQSIKNPNSQAAKACRLIAARHRLAMTGTPVENHLGELWSLFEFLNPGMLGKASVFRRLAGEGRPSDASGLQTLSKALRPFLLRRTKGQVLEELPEKTEQTIYCELGKRQRQMYDELKAHYRQVLVKQIDTIGLAKAKIQVLEALLRLRQAACHPGLIDPGNASAPSAKLDILLEHLQEVLQEEHKALVFSQFTSLLSLLRQRLDAQNITYEYLDGRTRDRGKKVERFQQDPDCRLFLISLKAGGLGLNLTAADYVFILDPWWNPAVEAQAVDRAHRIGQTRRVFAYRLIARNTVEEKILDLQKEKQQLADAVITADQRVLTHLSLEDLQLLLS